ncbi:hypothetical protein M514_03217 [Trichuris suis]|uniref:PH domain-containing protein n=1 Tax=Trichuris suis TaxID=68888 RepID=A0A085MX28_9BILA|nr:hypothetical protein M514_03217 [Trichuris suis]
MDSSQDDVVQVDNGKVVDEEDVVETGKCVNERKGSEGLATFRNLPLGHETLGTVRQLMADSKALLMKRKKLKDISPFSPSPSDESQSISFHCRDEQIGFSSVPRSYAHSSSIGNGHPSKRRTPSDGNETPSRAGRSAAQDKHGEIRDDRTYWYFILACSVVALLTAWPSFPNLIAGFLWACLLNVYLSMDRDVCPSPELIGAPKDNKAVCDIVASREKPVFKGWINRLNVEYDPATYHVRQTQSVLAVLHGSILRLLVPKRKVLKHTSCFETTSEPTFVSQRVFDLRGAAVVLRPQRLARRRWWSRKYPICIQLDSRHNAPAEMKFHRKFSTASDSQKLEEAPKGSNALSRSQSLLDVDNVTTHGKPKVESTQELYIFARTTREKEQWFFKLLAATGCLSKDIATRSHRAPNDAEFGRTAVSLSPECLFLQTVLSIYETYRVGLVNNPEPLKDTISMNLIDHMHKKDSVPPPLDEALFDKQISWINAILSRFCYTCDLRNCLSPISTEHSLTSQLTANGSSTSSGKYNENWRHCGFSSCLLQLSNLTTACSSFHCFWTLLSWLP